MDYIALHDVVFIGCWG